MLRTGPDAGAGTPVPGGAGGGGGGPAAVARPARVLSDWLVRAVREDTRLQPRLLRLADGGLLALDVDRWAGPVTAADRSLLSRARGAVLDVGCGPGRLTAALHEHGVPVCGLDVLPAVPVLARRAGAAVHVGDVFGPVPGEGSWGTVLLADGNLGIGGSPVRLLRRCAALARRDGVVLVELQPVAGERPVTARLEGLGTTSAWFPWALVGADAVAGVAARAGLRVTEQWSAEGRDFAALVRA
ncbi:MAG TPA: class I SAM-dependent methyltransferase [Mycobacteriales bacterium]|nr:class I SAM-dependent methyltransferase [Mycobacteriales bacterium]